MVALAASIPAKPALAQGGGTTQFNNHVANHVAPFWFDWDSWRFVPIIQQSGGVTTVQSFLALAGLSDVSGDNLVAVWYQRVPGGTTWVTQSWASTDQAVIIASVRAELGIPPEEDYRWGADGEWSLPLLFDPAIKEQYVNGVLITDPLAWALTQAPDLRAALLPLLVNAGYPAAQVPIEKLAENTENSSCPPDAILKVMAEGVEVGLS